MYQWIQSHNVDVIVLQETYCTENIVSDFELDWNGTSYHRLTKSSHSCGVSILFSKKLIVDDVDIHRDLLGHKILLNCKIQGHLFSIICAYAHNGQIYRNLEKWCSKHVPQDSTILCGGDLNTATTKQDRTSGILDPVAPSLLKLIENLELQDMWSYLNNINTDRYTWVYPANSIHRSRIDHILISRPFANSVRECTILNAPVPDHKCIKITIRIYAKPRGPSYWKLNIDVIKENEYIEAIGNIFGETVNNY